MSKAKQKKKISQLKRKQLVEEVFKKGKKQREVAKKFDEKIAQKQGSAAKREKLRQLKRKVSLSELINVYEDVNLCGYNFPNENNSHVIYYVEKIRRQLQQRTCSRAG